MQTMRWYATLARLFFKMNVKSTASYYGWSFVGVYVAHVLGYITSYVTIWASMRSFGGVMGWSMQDVMFLYSLDLFSYALANMFVQPFWRMNELVGQGKLDGFLLRPMNSFVHIVLNHIEFGYLAHISVALAAIIVTLVLSPVAFTALSLLALLTTLAGAFLIQCALGVMPACMAFWVIESSQFASLIRFGSRDFVQYPIVIYPTAIRFIISFIVPVAFVNYYPSLMLLGKAEGLWHLAPLYTLGIGLLLAFATLRLWHFSVRRYSSSG